MPKGEATRESVELLMANTASIEVLKNDSDFGSDYGGFVFDYLDVQEGQPDKTVLGAILIARDANGQEVGRMITQIRAVQTQEEWQEEERRFKEMNP